MKAGEALGDEAFAPQADGVSVAVHFRGDLLISRAIVVCCPMGGVEPYGGPRSRWGARLARAVHDAVASGAASAMGRVR